MNRTVKPSIELTAEICFAWAWDAKKSVKAFDKLVTSLKQTFKVQSQVLNTPKIDFDIYIILDKKKIKLYSKDLEGKLLDDIGIEGIVSNLTSSFK